jgi:hypothetical protein
MAVFLVIAVCISEVLCDGSGLAGWREAEVLVELALLGREGDDAGVSRFPIGVPMPGGWVSVQGAAPLGGRRMWSVDFGSHHVRLLIRVRFRSELPAYLPHQADMRLRIAMPR